MLNISVENPSQGQKEGNCGVICPLGALSRTKGRKLWGDLSLMGSLKDKRKVIAV